MTRKLVLLIIILIFTLSACAPKTTPTEAPAVPTAEPTEAPEPTKAPEPTEEPTVEPEVEMMVFTDDMGNTIELAEHPQAIVSLSPSMTEILFAIGAGDQVIGRDDFSLYPEAALAVPSIGSLFEGLPTESILAAEPDLVVAAQIITAEQVQTLTELGLTVYWQANPTDFSGLYDNLMDLARLTGHEEKTEAMVAELESRVDGVLENVALLSYTPSVFYELDGSEPSSPWTSGTGTFIDYIITTAGGINAAGAVEGDYAQLSSEELITANPDVILLGDAVYGTTPESVIKRAGWEAIKAIQTGNILPIDPHTLSVPGPRLVDGLEEVFRLIHPIVENGRGTPLYVTEPYVSIVSISPSTTEILFAIGAGDQVIGRDEVSVYPEEALEVTSVGALWGELPTEAILALEPDLVVAAQIISEEQVQTLEDLGVTVYWQPNPMDFNSLYDNLTDMGILTGQRLKAEALNKSLKTRVDAALEMVAGVTETPSVFYELDATDPSSPWTAGAGTFIDYIITLAGGINIGAELEGDYTQISAETLIASNPDIILLADALYGVTPERVAERPGWEVITAVINDAIYPIDPNIMSVPGPRLVDALEETVRLLHPELFE